MSKIFTTKEQQIEEIEKELQGFIYNGFRPIAKIDHEVVAQFFIDEYDGEELLLSVQEVRVLVENVWDEFVKKTTVFNEAISESTGRAIQYVNDAVGHYFREAVKENLDDFKIEQKHLTEELADNIDEVIVKTACDLEIKLGADVYGIVSDDITKFLQNTELNI